MYSIWGWLRSYKSVKKWKIRCHALVLKGKGLQKIVNTSRTPSLFKGSRYGANAPYTPPHQLGAFQ